LRATHDLLVHGIVRFVDEEYVARILEVHPASVKRRIGHEYPTDTVFVLCDGRVNALDVASVQLDVRDLLFVQEFCDRFEDCGVVGKYDGLFSNSRRQYLLYSF
jgi:hypothetical protein